MVAMICSQIQILSDSSYKLSSTSSLCYQRRESSVTVSCSKSDYVAHKFKLHEKESDKPKFDFACLRNPDDAIAMFDEMMSMPQRQRPSVIDFTKLLNAVVRMKHFSAALHLFDVMLQMDAPRNTYTFNTAIDCLCRLNRVDLGFAILGSIFKHGYEPDVVTFNNLIKGLLLVGNVSEAGELYNNMLREKVCKPNEYTRTIYINGLCKAGHTLSALELLKLFEKERFKPGVQVFNIIIASLLKDGMIDEALSLFSAMVFQGISPDVSTFNAMIQGICSFSRWREFEDILKSMVARNVSLDGEMSKKEEGEHILYIMKQMDVQPDIITYTTLIDGYGSRGEMDKARRIFDLAVDSGIKLNIVCYNSLINGYCKKGWINQAWSLFLAIPDVQPDIITYTTLIDGYGSLGELDKARGIFDLAVDAGLKLEIVSYNSLIKGYCKKGMINEAWNLFLAIPTQIEKTVFSYTIMLQGLFRGGRCDDGLKLFEEMQARNLCPSVVTYNTVLKGLCRAREIAEAFSMLQRMEDDGVFPGIITYNILIDGLCKDGEIERAKDLFKQLLSKGLQPDVVTFSILIGALSEDGQIEEAKDLMVKMVDMGCVPSGVTYNVYAQSLLRRKQIRDAIAVLEEMETKGFKMDVATFDLAKKLNLV